MLVYKGFTAFASNLTELILTVESWQICSVERVRCQVEKLKQTYSRVVKNKKNKMKPAVFFEMMIPLNVF